MRAAALLSTVRIDKISGLSTYMITRIEIFPWNENFATGIDEIDVQHRKLIELLNVLVRHLALQAEVPALNEIIDQLKEYAAIHFRTEEAIWHKYFQGDPWELWHQRAHEDFVDQVIQMQAEGADKPFDEVIERIVTFLTHWLALHIIESDKRMAKVVLCFPSGCSLEQAKKQADDAMSGATRTLIETVMEMYDKLANHTVRMTREIVKRQRAEEALRKAHEELRIARDQAVRANEAKSEYLALISHEIRSPLQGVLGYADLLNDKEISEEERQAYSRIILDSGKTMLGMVDDILDYSKMEAGKLDLIPRESLPLTLMGDVCALFAKTADAKGLGLKADWAGSTDQFYLIDPVRIRQMLNNLVNNAIKFTRSGNIVVSGKELSRSGSEARLLFSVTDTGMGIKPEFQPRLFNRFEQDADVKITGRGTGLGLSIVRALALLMEGDVGVESEPGQGARFWFAVKAALPS